jgi:hydroxyquinol 1,2-dioxygenase
MAEQDKLTITRAAIGRLAHAKDARFRRVMTSLIRHLHDFARDVDLTEEEWMAAIGFLTDTGKMCTGKRQEFILLSDTLGVSMLTVMLAQARGGKGATEATVQGPFFWEGAPEMALGSDIANGVVGEPAYYSGRVLDAKGKPLGGAVIDVWSVDAGGLYDMQTGETMRARAKLRTDRDGRYSFWSVRPADYPVPTDGPVGRMLRAMGRHAMRPAHMHFMVRAEGHRPLITHVFDSRSKYLDSDAVFGVRDSLVTDFRRHKPGNAPDGKALDRPFYTVEFDVRLQPPAKRARTRPRP